MADVVALVQAGKDLGYVDDELKDWVKAQQDDLREQRKLEREKLQKLGETEELEREKMKLDDSLEREKTEIEREKLRVERERLEVEKTKIEDSSQTSKGKTKLPVFNEEKDRFDAYISRFESYASMRKWKKDDWSLQLSLLLAGKTLDVFYGLSESQQKDYDVVKEALMRKFSLTEEEFRKQLFNTKVEQGESPQQFMVRIERLFQKWVEASKITKSYEGLGSLILREEFYKRCHADLAAYLREKSEDSLPKVATMAQHYLDAHGGAWFNNGKRFVTAVKEEKVETNDSRSCDVCKKSGHSTQSCWFKDQNKSTKKCFRCGSLDHMVKDCTKPKDGVAAAVLEDSSPRRGMMAKYKGRTTQQISKILNVPISEGKVNGENVLVLRDTAFGYAAVRSCLIHNDQYLDEYSEFSLLDGTPRKFQKALVTISCDFYSGPLKVLVVENPVADLVFGNVQTTRKTDRVDRNDGSDDLVSNELIKFVGEEQSDSVNDPVSNSVSDANDVQSIQLTEETKDCKTANVVEHISLANDAITVEVEVEEEMKPVAAVLTRGQTRREKKALSPLIVPSPEAVDKQTFIEFQKDDPLLIKYWQLVGEQAKVSKSGEVRFEEKNGLLFRVFTPRSGGNPVKQLLVPEKLRLKVLTVAHDSMLSGHCGIKRTLDRVMSNFYWKDVHDDVRRYCRSCDICQKTLPKGRHGKAPLQKMPVMKEPFKRVAVDIVGPIVPCSERGHRFIVTVVDYATRYPEAESLKKIDAISVAEALFGIFCRVGFPSEILTDQGTQFMSDIMKEVNRLLSIKQLRTTAWHPMCNGLVERFNGTLKTILKRLCAEMPKQWDRYLPAVLFAYRSSIQESVGFSPFELLFGRKVKGPMDILRAYWSDEVENEEVKTVYQYVVDLRQRLEDTCKIAQEELLKAQETQKKIYDRTAKPKKFKVGDKALLLLPTKANKLLLQWKGPYVVVEQMSPVNYKIQIGPKQKNFHVNMLKNYVERETEFPAEQETEIPVERETDFPETENNDKDEDMSLIAASVVLKDGIGDEINEIIEVCPLRSTETWKDVKVSEHLTENQKEQVNILLQEFSSILTTLPGFTRLEEHEIRLTTDDPVRDTIYPIPYSQREVVSKEVESMLEMGVIRRSKSPYAAPPVLVQKPDESVRFCINFKKLNCITVFDGEPMPCPEDVYIKMQGKSFRSKLDLTKGYWQIAMSEDSIEKTAFKTPEGQFEFLRLPFGLKNSAASFNRLMRQILGDIDEVGCFVDDVCIFTDTWERHLEVLYEVLARFEKAGLTVRPSKCMIGFVDVEFVGHKVNVDSLQPRTEKIEDVLNFERPQSKKQVKSFLAMSGYYSRFLPRFADVTYSLTQLTKKNAAFNWGSEEEEAFQRVKEMLSTEPVLKIANFEKTMYLQVDASDVGVGAALLQKHGGLYHPVRYASRKLKKAETSYSTIEKEGLAIIWAIQKFAVFLYGNEFVLLTDHKPLTFINQSKMHNARVMRWSMFLQDWAFRVESIKGVDNIMADYLSRN